MDKVTLNLYGQGSRASTGACTTMLYARSSSGNRIALDLRERVRRAAGQRFKRGVNRASRSANGVELQLEKVRSKKPMRALFDEAPDQP